MLIRGGQHQAFGFMPLSGPASAALHSDRTFYLSWRRGRHGFECLHRARRPCQRLDAPFVVERVGEALNSQRRSRSTDRAFTCLAWPTRKTGDMRECRRSTSSSCCTAWSRPQLHGLLMCPRSTRRARAHVGARARRRQRNRLRRDLHQSRSVHYADMPERFRWSSTHATRSRAWPGKNLRL